MNKRKGVKDGQKESQVERECRMSVSEGRS